LLAVGKEIGVTDMGLPSTTTTNAPGANTGNACSEAEPDRAAIEQALATAGGVVAQAAMALGMSRQALYRRLERLGISRA